MAKNPEAFFSETARSPTPRQESEISPNTNVVLQQILLGGLKELTETAEEKVLAFHMLIELNFLCHYFFFSSSASSFLLFCAILSAFILGEYAACMPLSFCSPYIILYSTCYQDMLGDRTDFMRSADFLANQWGLDWLNKTPVSRISLLVFSTLRWCFYA